MSNMMKELTVTTGQMLNNPHEPPRKRPWDILPGKVVGWFRTRFNFPDITPYERWLVTSIFAQRLLQGLYKRLNEDSIIQQAYAEQRNVPKSELN